MPVQILLIILSCISINDKNHINKIQVVPLSFLLVCGLNQDNMTHAQMNFEVA